MVNPFRSRVPRVIAALGLVLLSFSQAGAAGVAGATPEQDQISGAAVPLPSDQDENFKSVMRDAARRYGIEPRSEVFLVYHDGATYVVSSESEPEAGIATVSGTVVHPEELGSEDLGVVFADDVSVSQSATQVELSTLRENSQQFAGQVVVVSSQYNELSFLNDAGDVTTRNRLGMIGTQDGLGDLGIPPGQVARWLTINATSSEIGGSTLVDAGYRIAFRSGGGNFTANYKTTNYWIDAPSDVKILVLPEDFVGGQGQVDLWPIEATPRAVESVTSSELSARGSELEGEIVTVEGQTLGARISTQETLLAATSCAPDSITVPGVGCIPIPTDVAIHTGVVASPGSPEDSVSYVALSNHHQDVPVTDQRGDYRVTGRVVSTQELDPRLPAGYAIVAYDLERSGDLTLGAAARDQLQSRTENLTETFSSQLYMTHSEYQSRERKARAATDTPTATPSPTPVSSSSGSSGGDEDPDDQRNQDNSQNRVDEDNRVTSADERQKDDESKDSSLMDDIGPWVSTLFGGLGVLLFLSAAVTEVGFWLTKRNGEKVNPEYVRQKNLVATIGTAFVALWIGFSLAGIPLTLAGIVVLAGLGYGWYWAFSQF